MDAVTWRELLTQRFDTPNQGWATRWVSQRLGAAFAAFALVAGLSPNAVTVIGLAIAIAGCAPYIVGTGWLAWAGAAILWQLAFALDCADGQLARATKRSSRYGGWLDVYCDHIRQSATAIAVYAVLGANLDGRLAIAASFLFTAGMASYLHTASVMNVLKPAQGESSGPLSPVQMLTRTVLDTPLLLLGLCLVRPFPILLAALVSAIGALLIFRGVAIAGRRLRT